MTDTPQTASRSSPRTSATALVLFAITGTISTAVDISMIVLLEHFLPLHPTFILFCSTGVSYVALFGLRKSIMFRSTHMDHLGTEAIRFTGAYGFTSVLNFVLSSGLSLVSPLPLVITKLIATVLLASVNFYLTQHYVFRDEQARGKW